MSKKECDAESNDQVKLFYSPNKTLPRIEFEFDQDQLQEHRKMQETINIMRKKRIDQANKQHEQHSQLTSDKRMKIIYLYQIHRMPLYNIAELTNMNYSTVRTHVSVFKKSGGRLNKRLSFLSKKSILAWRRKDAQIIRHKRERKRRLGFQQSNSIELARLSKQSTGQFKPSNEIQGGKLFQTK